LKYSFGIIFIINRHSVIYTAHSWVCVAVFCRNNLEWFTHLCGVRYHSLSVAFPSPLQKGTEIPLNWIYLIENWQEMVSMRFCKGSHSYTEYKTLKQGCWRHIVCDVCAMLGKGKELNSLTLVIVKICAFVHYRPY